MSVYQVTRCMPNLSSFSTKITVSSPKPLDQKIINFFQARKKCSTFIHNSPPTTPPELKEKYNTHTHIDSMYSFHGLSDDDLATVISIADQLRKHQDINPYLRNPQRFKIPSLCSFTISKENLFIHCKKKANRYPLGKGTFSSFYLCLLITANKVAWVAEGTYKLSWTEKGEKKERHIPKSVHKELESIKKSFVLPQVGYPYTNTKKPEEAEFCKKYCRIFPLYHADLQHTLNYFFFTKLADPTTIWQIMRKAIEHCKELHAKGFSHRDIKKENYLVKFPVTKTGIDWNKPKIALGDIDMIIKETESQTVKKWCGTRDCWPPEEIRKDSPQSASADVYALGVLMIDCRKTLEEISALSKEDSKGLEELINYAKNYAANPSAEELYKKLTDHLKKHHPEISDC